MNRLIQAGLIFVAVFFLTSRPAFGDSPNKTNILLFIADDWGRNASCYRDPNRPGVNDVITTPNIDRLAQEGVLFRNASYDVTSCTPSRASIVTGCYFWRLGRNALHRVEPEWKNHSMDPGWKLPGTGTLLAADGYYLGSWGKTLHRHWFPAERVAYDGNKVRYSHWVLTQPDRNAAAKEIENIVRDGVRQMLAKRKKGQPFFDAIGPIGTHRPFVPGSGKTLWQINSDDLKGKLPAFLPDVPAAREEMADTLGEVLALDLYLGWVVDELKKAGEFDNTLFVLTGDNGIDMPRGKTQVYNLGTRAPLIIHWPAGISKPGRTVDDFVSLIDLAPTFLEVAGLKPHPTMNGRSLLPLLKSDKSGQIDPTRDFVVSGRELHDTGVRGGLPYPVRAIRTADFFYVRNFKPERWPYGEPNEPGFPGDPPAGDSRTAAWILSHRNDADDKTLFLIDYGQRPAEELYDLRKDPDEMNNVANEPAYAEARKNLAERLMKVLQDTNDPRITDDFDRPPYYLGPPPPKSSPGKPSKVDDPNCLEHANGDRDALTE